MLAFSCIESLVKIQSKKEMHQTIIKQRIHLIIID
jgi:hypothetical protein